MTEDLNGIRATIFVTVGFEEAEFAKGDIGLSKSLHTRQIILTV